MKKLLAITLLVCFLSVGIANAQTPAATATTTAAGLKLIDATRGIEFSAPNGFWGINAGKYSISLNHQTHYDAHVTLKKSWYTVGTAQEAYNKRKESLKSYLPGAVFIKENESLTVGGMPGMAMTYKNPSDLKIIREIMIVHKGQPYELVFQAKEENFQKVKADFGFILQNLKLF
jgi:hypothetical protein